MAQKVITRFYNATNLGDDLFIRILAERYAENFYISRRIFGTPKPEIDPFASQTNVKIGESLPEYIATRLLNRLLKRKEVVTFRNKKRGNILVYIGGSIFIEGSSLENWESELKAYKALKLPYYILGSNFGPHSSKRFEEIVSEIVQNSVDTCFRDKDSSEKFSHLNSTRQASDIVLTLNRSKYENIHKPKHVVISLIDGTRKFESQISEKYEGETVKLIEKLAREDYSITLMSFCQFEGDEEAINRVLVKMDPDIRAAVKPYFYRGNLDEALDIIAKCEIVVATRFHAMVLGLLFGKKVLPLAYSSKTTNFLKDLNFNGPVIEIDKIEKFDALNFDLNSITYQEIEDSVSNAQSQFAELDKILKRRQA